MEELCEHLRGDILGSSFDQPQAKMHMAEQATLGGGSERWAPTELGQATDVVQECGAL
jgi:hypothetical protein